MKPAEPAEFVVFRIPSALALASDWQMEPGTGGKPGRFITLATSARSYPSRGDNALNAGGPLVTGLSK